MRRSTERVLTTHTGSLPRPSDLDEMLFDLEQGRRDDRAAFDERVRAAVVDTIDRQMAAGIDVVNNGEVGKTGFFNYVKDRLTGFGGEMIPLAPKDLFEFPEVFARVYQNPAYANLKLPACDGPIEVRDPDAVHRDIEALRGALGDREPAGVFMSAASPGLIADTLGNSYYPTLEEYLFALADAMKWEYDAIAAAGFVLQVDAPDLAAFRTVGPNTDLSEEAYVDQIRLHVRALNHAVRDIAPESMRMHVCWGNTELPHIHDIPLASIMDVVLEARPAGISVAAANPRHEHEWELWADGRLPEGKVLIPGVIDSTTNYVEHRELVAQRIARYAGAVGRDNVIAGTDCGFGSLAGLYPVDPKVTWLKLQTLAEGARLASERLW